MSGGGVIGRHDITRDELYFLAGEALTHRSFHGEREVSLKVTCLQKDAQRDDPGRGMADDKEPHITKGKDLALITTSEEVVTIVIVIIVGISIIITP